ncbi:LOW QUALITY PROTEIN: hypothetical protein ACHAW5_009732 [Stephanodiscus triporus]|uniref:Uncharacterized protein n=1 Tax=Stephanodiscus triporus TaxID=2934178 RepID=A0ABD3QPX6_9STRA
MPPCKVRAASRATTLRKMTSSSLSEDDMTNASPVMIERARGMSHRAREGMPLTREEIRDVVNSLRNVTPAPAVDDDSNDNIIDWVALEGLLSEVVHVPHVDWDVTGTNSTRLAEILLPDGGVGGGLTTSRFAHVRADTARGELGRSVGARGFVVGRRIVLGGGGGGGGGGRRPWAVLVTGVNGIRQTTSVHQPWFANVLRESLVSPSSSSSSSSSRDDGEGRQFALEDLPTGGNSFFRQLDHMIATLCNEDFSALYALTGAQLRNDDRDGTKRNGTMGKNGHNITPPRDLIEKYSNLKGGIFSRYRTLSELLGVILLREAQRANLNVMCETSGRDKAMFHYVDHFFPSGGRYNKLALHFSINDLDHAMRSVDSRMVDEMRMGREALESGDVVEVIYANLGGPYGSEALGGVREDSDRVWDEIVTKGDGGGVGGDWYKSAMRINAHSGKPWTIQAVRPDGSFGEEYTFCDPRAV